MSRPLDPPSARARPSLSRVFPAVAPLVALLASGCVFGSTEPRPAATPSPVVAPPATGPALRVLFVGNSLTRTNDLPGMVAAISRAAGDSIPILTGMVAINGASLEDHLADGTAAAAIAAGGWDVVALQQGPSSLDESREQLIRDTRIFASKIAAAGATPALYMVWPEEARIGVLDRVIESYTLAAEDVRGRLLPAGAAWKAAWATDPDLPLYGPDRFHPSVLGTYLAALTARAALLGRSPVGSPARFELGGATVTISAADAATAQAAAEQVTRGMAPLGEHAARGR